MSVNWPLLSIAGVPTNGVNEVQSLALSGTPGGGTFTLTYDGQTTAAIAYNASAGTVEQALENLSNVEPGDIACSGGPLPGAAITMTFRRNLGGKNVAAITGTFTGLTGGSNPNGAITTSTAGVQGTHRGAQYGCLLCDTTNGKLYTNTGDEYAPVWTEYDPS